MLLSTGLVFSVLVTAVITDAIKDAVGRPRPDFFWRCFPDGKDVCPELQFLYIALRVHRVCVCAVHLYLFITNGTWWLITSQVYDTLGNVVCHGDKIVIKEGHKSFPSGHTSCKLYCAYMATFFFLGWIKVNLMENASTWPLDDYICWAIIKKKRKKKESIMK